MVQDLHRHIQFEDSGAEKKKKKPGGGRVEDIKILTGSDQN